MAHVLVGSSLAACAPAHVSKMKLGIILAVLAALPDIDVVGFKFGISYGSMFGHRGFSHSFVFAGLAGLGSTLLFFRSVRPFSKQFLLLCLLLSSAVASHGILDTFTDAGRGVGLLLPFDDTRYFAPWRPIAASGLSVSSFLNGSVLTILVSEFQWIGIPVLSALAGFLGIKWYRGRGG